MLADDDECMLTRSFLSTLIVIVYLYLYFILEKGFSGGDDSTIYPALLELM